MISELALPVGVTAVVQFYARMRQEGDFQSHKATQKLISFKALILVNAIQSIIFSILTGKGYLGSPYDNYSDKTVSYKDLSIGLPHLLLTIEQLVVGIWFFWSFSAQEYRDLEKSTPYKLPIWRAALDSLNPMDILLGLVLAFKLLRSGVGPRGNGTWTRSGGYKELKGQTQQQQIQLDDREPLHIPYEAQSGASNPYAADSGAFVGGSGPTTAYESIPYAHPLTHLGEVSYPRRSPSPYDSQAVPSYDPTSYDQTFDYRRGRGGYGDEEGGGLLPPDRRAQYAKHQMSDYGA